MNFFCIFPTPPPITFLMVRPLLNDEVWILFNLSCHEGIGRSLTLTSVIKIYDIKREYMLAVRG